jgi:hypothetical protein
LIHRGDHLDEVKDSPPAARDERECLAGNTGKIAAADVAPISIELAYLCSGRDNDCPSRPSRALSAGKNIVYNRLSF